LVPPIPTKDALGRFTKEVVLYRRREFNRFLKRVVHHPSISKSKNVDAFLNLTEEEFAKFIAPEKAATERASSFFSSVFTSVSTLATTLTTDVQETDPWFSTQDSYLQDLNRDFSALRIATNANTKIKADLIQTLKGLSDGCCAMEKFEGVHKQQSTSLYFGKLSEVCQSVGDLDETVVKNETEFFEDAVTDHHRLTVAAQRLLTNRKQAQAFYQDAQAQTAKGSDPEAPTKEAEKKQTFDTYTANSKEQLENFHANKSKEMRWALRELVRENIEYGEQMLATWKEMERQLDKTELQ